MMKTTRTKWLFTPSETDMRMVEAERRRLTELNPAGVTITRADAMRSLFARASLGASFTPSPVTTEDKTKAA